MPRQPYGPGSRNVPGHVALDELARVRHEVAAVADDDRVAIEPRAQLAVDARRLDRRGVGLERRQLGRALRLLVGAEPRDPVVVRAGRRAALGQRGERRREVAGGRRRERRVRARSRSRRRTGARRARRRTARSRAGSRAAFPRRARDRLPSSATERARENASSWSAGSVPRPMPFTNTGTRAASANARSGSSACAQ